ILSRNRMQSCLRALKSSRLESSSPGSSCSQGCALLDARTLPFVDHAVLHHEHHLLRSMNVLERISRDGDDVGEFSRFDGPDPLVPTEQLRAIQRSCGE